MNIASTLHRLIYGKDDDPNAPENQTLEFQAGYRYGCDKIDSDQDFAMDSIRYEWDRRGKPVDGQLYADFREWKRGLWAAIHQQAEANSEYEE